MSYPIHLPLNDGVLCRCYVTKDKLYGSLLGSELIEIYGIKRQKEIVTKSIEINGNSLFIPSGFLDNTSLEILKEVERLTDTKILHRREPRATKKFMNVTLTF